MTRTIQNPDEFVLEDVKMFHYEVMEQGKAVWLGIYLNDGKIYHMNIGGDNLWVNYSYECTGQCDDPIPDGVDPYNLGGRGQ